MTTFTGRADLAVEHVADGVPDAPLAAPSDAPVDARPEVPPGVQTTRPVDLHQLYREQFLPLTRLAAMLLGDRAVAQDVVQDVFASLHDRWGRFGAWPEPRLLGYTRKAVLNGARSALRHRAVVAAHTVGAPEPVVAAEDAALSRLGEQNIRAALAGLPRRQREVVLLRYLLDLSAAETARALGISVSAVTSSAARGVTALQAVLGTGEDS